MAFTFSRRSRNALIGVHPDLVRVVELALESTSVDFTVVEGLRSLDKQREYLAKGVSKTLKSRHLRQSDGYGHAVDLYPYYDGSVQVHAPIEKFQTVADAMQRAAQTLNVSITRGIDWGWDAPHFQLELPSDKTR